MTVNMKARRVSKSEGRSDYIIRRMTKKDAIDASRVIIATSKDAYERYEHWTYPKKAHKFDLANSAPERIVEDIGAKYSYAFVLERGGKIIGVAKGRIFSQSGFAHLNSICIHPDMQGMGYGSKLLRHAMKHCKKQGCHKLSLNTMACLMPAMNLYLKNGFAPEAFLRKQWWKADFILMSVWFD